MMIVVASSIFHTLQFPHQGKIVTIDQLDFCTPDIYNHSATNVPFLKYSKLSYESFGVVLLKYSSLMGNFPMSAPNPRQQDATINTILTLSHQSPGSYDPGVVLHNFEIASLFPISHDPIPLSSSFSGEHLMISTHVLRRTKRKGGKHRK